MDKTLQKNLIILLICLIASGLFGVLFIVYPEFDFLNYRYYNGWAFLNNRIDIDIMPAGFRTYFNPLIDAANYILIEKLNKQPYIYLFISGLKLGLFSFLSYIILDYILVGNNTLKNLSIISSIILIVFSPVILYVSGYCYTDLQPAILILISIYLYLISIFEKTNKSKFLLFLSAFILGFATGLKYTQIIFAISLILCTLYNKQKIYDYKKTLLSLLTGLFLGFILSGGPWMYVLYCHFENPMFPYFNNIFNSNMAEPSSILAMDFQHLRPNCIMDFIFTPLKNPLTGFVGIEKCFFDIKLQLVFLSTLFYAIALKNKKIKSNINQFVNYDIFNIIIFLTISTYYINLLLFAQLRYITPLFVFFPVIILTVAYSICSIKKFNQEPINIYYICLTLITIFFTVKNNINQMNLFFIILFWTILIVYCILMFYFLLKKTSLNRNLHIITTLIVIICLFTTYFMQYPMLRHEHFSRIAIIKNVNIENNANVICGSALTTFIIPFQNPSAKYYGFTIPNNYEQQYGYYYKYTKYNNMYFKNKYLEKRIKELFLRNEPLYFVYSKIHIIHEFKLYEKAIEFYSDGKISKIDNCKKVPTHILETYNNAEIYICKLK